MDVFNQRTLFSGFERNVVDAIRGLPREIYYLRSGCRFVDIDQIRDNDVFSVHFRLLGGKGGFGSTLRSFRTSKSSNKLMCRTLTGRRLADVEEEKRLRKWAAKKAEREKEQARRKKEKYEKLKQGGPKHQFADVDYLRKRDLVLDEIEDAIEAAFSNVDDKPTSSKASEPKKMEEEAPKEASDGSDLDEGPFIIEVNKKNNKRKIIAENKENADNKKPKLDEEKPAPDVHESDKSAPIEQAPRKELPKAAPSTLAQSKETNEKPAEPKPQNAEAKPTPPAPEKVDYEPIDLKDFNSAVELQALGLGHLKHALESRGLKCGGTLEERAERLFSVRGLPPKKYPKKIRAAPKK